MTRKVPLALEPTIVYDSKTRIIDPRIGAKSLKIHEDTILNYFLNRSTNASAESFIFRVLMNLTFTNLCEMIDLSTMLFDI